MELKNNLEVATFGGGCFWCLEAVFDQLKGVEKVISGYSGGHIKNPCYREVCNGTTGHAEVTEIHYNPAIISYETLLHVFWVAHDPTTLNRQGNDVGTQYRSVIYYHTDQQKMEAEKSKEKVATTYWNDPIVTEIEKAGVFYRAEENHQDFYKLNPDYGYCQFVVNPKVAKVRASFYKQLK